MWMRAVVAGAVWVLVLAGVMRGEGMAVERAGGKVVYRGVVVDEGGKGIGGVRYKVFHFEWPVQRMEVEGVTGADGGFVVGPVAEDEKGTINRQVLVDVPGKGWAWRDLRSDAPEVLFRGMKVEAREGLSVSGVVRDEAGKAAAGAAVEALVSDPRFGMFAMWEPTGMAVRTDGAGRFAFARMPVGARVQLQVTSSGGQYSMWREFGPDVYPVRVGMEDVELVIKPGGTVRVATGVGGVWVEGTERYHMERVQRVKAGVDGVALFSQIGPGTWDFVAKRQAGLEGVAAPVEGVVVARGKTEAVTMAVVPGVELRGRLVDAGTGEGVRGAVYVQPGDNERLQQRAEVDEEGRFGMRVAPGPYTVMSNGYENGQGKMYTQVVEAKEGMGEVMLAVHPRPRVKGVLVDGEGKGVKGVVVMGDSDGTVTDEAGRFEVEAQEVEGGTARGLAVDAGGKLGRGFAVDVSRGTAEARVELLPMGEVRGRVVDRAGGAAGDAEVELSMRNARGGWSTPTQWLWRAAVGADGGFMIKPVPAGVAVDLLVRREVEQAIVTIGELRAGEAREVGEVVLHEPGAKTRPADRTVVVARVKSDGEVSGVVVDEAGRVVVGARVSAVKARGNGADDVTDLKGRFTLKGVARDEAVEVGAMAGRRAGKGKLTPGKAGEVQIFPVAFEFMGKAAPALLVDRWIVPGPGGAGPEAWADLKGKVVVLQVGAWWKSGGRDAEQVKGLLKRHGAEGLVGVTLHIRSNASDAEMQAYAKREGIDWALGVDADPAMVVGWDQTRRGGSATESLFGGQAGLFLIDRQGVLRAAPDWREVDAVVEKLLGE